MCLGRSTPRQRARRTKTEVEASVFIALWNSNLRFENLFWNRSSTTTTTTCRLVCDYLHVMRRLEWKTTKLHGICAPRKRTWGKANVDAVRYSPYRKRMTLVVPLVATGETRPGTTRGIRSLRRNDNKVF